MKTLLLICLLLFGSAAAVTVFAEESAFDELSSAVKRKTVEKMASNQPAKSIKGNVTGGACNTAADCAPGCAKAKGEVTCLNIQEVNACPGGTLPPGGLQCTCLTSVGKCGFATP